MTMREIQQAIYRRLLQGPVEAVDCSLPIPGYPTEAIDAALNAMHDAGQIKAVGVSDVSTHYGVLVEEFCLPQHRHLCQV